MLFTCCIQKCHSTFQPLSILWCLFFLPLFSSLIVHVKYKKKKVSFFSACFLFILFSCNYPAFPKNTHHLYIFWVFFYFFFSEFRWTTVLTQKIFKSKMFFPSLIKHFKWGYFLILTTDYPHLNFWLLSPRFMIFITSISLNFFPVHFTIEHFSYIWFSYYWLLR